MEIPQVLRTFWNHCLALFTATAVSSFASSVSLKLSTSSGLLLGSVLLKKEYFLPKRVKY